MNQFMAENQLQTDKMFQQPAADFESMFCDEERKIFETRSEKSPLKQLNHKRIRAPDPEPIQLNKTYTAKSYTLSN